MRADEAYSVHRSGRTLRSMDSKMDGMPANVDSAVTWLMRRYAERPLLQTLVTMIPWGVGTYLDKALAGRVGQIDKKRLATFFDELN